MSFSSNHLKLAAEIRVFDKKKEVQLGCVGDDLNVAKVQLPAGLRHLTAARIAKRL